MRQIHDTRLVFIHIPKTAGMAVVNAFGLEHQTSDHSLTSPTDLPLLDSRFVRFTVFRNPVSRFVSAYKYSLSMLHNYRGNSVREDILNHGLDKDVNLFLSFYQDKKQRLASNIHFTPQWYYYTKCKPSIVLRQEQLATDIDIVARLAPQHFVGLTEKNKSPSPADVNTTLSEKSVETVNQIYRNDFFLWNM
jgi:hypothetical protein